MPVTRRRFMLLAVALVAVNAFFWLAQGGFAIPQTLVNQFFGKRMVRAEVVLQAADGSIQDWRIDRGQIPCLPGERMPLGSSASLSVSQKRR